MRYSEGLFYKNNADGSVCVKSLGKCTDTHIVLPPVRRERKVEHIGDYAFLDCADLTRITIPDSVTSIGEWAFFGCTRLTSIVIPNSVASVGRYAFGKCVRLLSVSHNYKAFLINKAGNLQCENQGFYTGEKTCCSGHLRLYENGIHYHTNIFDIFNNYYGEYGKDFVIGICDVSDENIGICDVSDEDIAGCDISTRCARWVIPNRILTREEVINIMNGGDISE